MLTKTYENKVAGKDLEQVNIYAQDRNTIYHGEALQVLRSIKDSTVDLIFVDPPYNIGKKFGSFLDKWDTIEDYVKWSYLWIDQCIRVLKPSGSMYVMTSTQAMPYFDIYIGSKMTILSRIVWHYDSSGVQAKNYFGSLYEPILHCAKTASDYVFNSQDILVEAKTGAKRKLIDYRKPQPTPYNNVKVPGNVWYFPRVRYRMAEYEDHPSQKPEALLERIIKASSNEGDLVLDHFAGTFTTGAVAKRLKRQFIGIESQYDYVKIGLRRVLGLSEFDGEELSAPQKNYNRNQPEEDAGDIFQWISLNMDSRPT